MAQWSPHPTQAPAREVKIALPHDELDAGVIESVRMLQDGG